MKGLLSEREIDRNRRHKFVFVFKKIYIYILICLSSTLSTFIQKSGGGLSSSEQISNDEEDETISSKMELNVSSLQRVSKSSPTPSELKLLRNSSKLKSIFSNEKLSNIDGEELPLSLMILLVVVSVSVSVSCCSCCCCCCRCEESILLSESVTAAVLSHFNLLKRVSFSSSQSLRRF